MTKIKKRTSRYFQEQDHLFETSDISSLHKKTKQHKDKAAAAEQISQKKIVTINTPVNAVMAEDDQPSNDLGWDDWLDR